MKQGDKITTKKGSFLVTGLTGEVIAVLGKSIFIRLDNTGNFFWVQSYELSLKPAS